MKTDERNKFAIKSFLGEYLDLRKDKDNELATVDSIRKGVEFKGANLWILIFAIFRTSYLALSLLKPVSLVAPVITWSSTSRVPSALSVSSLAPAILFT